MLLLLSCRWVWWVGPCCQICWMSSKQTGRQVSLRRCTASSSPRSSRSSSVQSGEGTTATYCLTPGEYAVSRSESLRRKVLPFTPVCRLNDQSQTLISQRPPDRPIRRPAREHIVTRHSYPKPPHVEIIAGGTVSKSQKIKTVGHLLRSEQDVRYRDDQDRTEYGTAGRNCPPEIISARYNRSWLVLMIL